MTVAINIPKELVEIVGLVKMTGAALVAPLTIPAGSGFTIDTADIAPTAISFVGTETTVPAVVDRINAQVAAAGGQAVAFAVPVGSKFALELRGRKMVVTAPHPGSIVATVGFGGVKPIGSIVYFLTLTDTVGGVDFVYQHRHRVDGVDVSDMSQTGTAAAAIKAQIQTVILPDFRQSRALAAAGAIDPTGGGIDVSGLNW